IWWGHRIPAYHCERCSYITVAKEHPGKCKGCGSSHITQDPDVLDTWFSSWLWPLSTLGWPEKTADLKAFYPTTFLSTAPEILFFWVARMIMAGLYFEDQIPFSEVYLHATVCDWEGRKMSKSLGNGIDPLEVVAEYGADSLRFSVLYLAPIGQRIRLAKENFEMGSRFANKIWNAAKFILMNAQEGAGTGLDKTRFNDWDKWILMELDAAILKIRDYLDTFRFSEAANELYHFIWSKFCDWYLEVSKGRIYSKDGQEKKAVMGVLLHVMDHALRLLHPIMPFITEEIWQKLPGRVGESIMLADFPQAGEWGFEEAREHIALLQDVIYHVRNIRGDAGITPDKKVSLIFSAEESLNRIIEKYSKEIQALAKVEEIEFKKVHEKPEKTMSAVGSGFEIFVKLDGMQDLERTRSKLENPEFRDKAPEAIVAKEREKLSDCQQKMAKLEELLKELI
ncbi:MAG: valine--tRNA ligase, partial [Spirochaetae bacterium HGW-Spirochaetae-6]